MEISGLRSDMVMAGTILLSVLFAYKQIKYEKKITIICDIYDFLDDFDIKYQTWMKRRWYVEDLFHFYNAKYNNACSQEEREHIDRMRSVDPYHHENYEQKLDDLLFLIKKAKGKSRRLNSVILFKALGKLESCLNELADNFGIFFCYDEKALERLKDDEEFKKQQENRRQLFCRSKDIVQGYLEVTRSLLDGCFKKNAKF